METEPLRAPGSRQRIVVFTSSLSHAVRQGIVAIDDAIDGLEWLVVHEVPRKRALNVLRNQWRNLRRNGWRWIPYQAGELWQALCRRTAEPPAPSRIGRECRIEALAERAHMRIERVDDLHGDATLDSVRAFGPDLGLSLAAPILKERLFRIPRQGTINLHKGKLPEFRGMPPAFWELWHDRREVGCSVHRVDARLDTGELLGELRVRRATHSTVRGLQIELDEAAIGLTVDVVRQVLDGSARPVAQSPEGAATYRKPKLAQVAALRARLEPRPRGTAAIKVTVKNALARTFVGARAAGAWRWLSPRVTVLLYHRVSDDARDNLTTGIEQFDRRMEWLAAHCRVLAIEEVLEMKVVPRSDRPLVAITFDDGYLDNYSYAAPILRRHGLPAAFFVATGIVGTDRPFPHDVRRENPPIAKMTWDHLRQLHRWGFTIGSHTVNHIDCAGEAEDVVWDELDASRKRLQAELGLQDVVLAYPYGGRHHMTPQRLELVKRAGYRGCLSAYGGTNIDKVDRFNVLRCSDMHEFSDWSFRRVAVGLG